MLSGFGGLVLLTEEPLRSGGYTLTLKYQELFVVENFLKHLVALWDSVRQPK